MTQCLSHLIEVSRNLGMEPLVEVNSDHEMTIAVEIGAKVIGINNRNLHTFSVDLNTTARLVNGVKSILPSGTRVAALSGISNREDVMFFEGKISKKLFENSRKKQFLVNFIEISKVLESTLFWWEKLL